MEGARRSVQLHNIGSMCMTALPTQISLVQFSSDIHMSVSIYIQIDNQAGWAWMLLAYMLATVRDRAKLFFTAIGGEQPLRFRCVQKGLTIHLCRFLIMLIMH